MSETDARQTIAEAVATVRNVRTVPLVRLARENGTDRPIVLVKIGLPPMMTVHDAATVIAHVQLTVARLVERGTAVHVEPDVAADQATPTEAIVIRALE